jgi:hypothetical protein
MRSWFAVLLILLTGCTQQGWNDRLASKEEQATVLNIADAARRGDWGFMATAEPAMAQDLTPDLSKRMTTLLRPIPGPFTLQTVSSFTMAGGPTSKTFVLQAGRGSRWAIVTVVMRGRDGLMRLAGLYVDPMPTNPAKVNDFSVSRHGPIGYAWLFAMAACSAICVWATILIWRERWLKRRWLWTLGSLVGFVGFGLNWSTGGWAVLPLYVSLLGAQAVKAGPYAPWTLTFGLPIVAILVIVRWYRRSPRAGDAVGD